jgi:hypothetical protein
MPWVRKTQEGVQAAAENMREKDHQDYRAFS